MLAPGTRLGRYEILFTLASGGMATVYAARAIGEGRFRKPVALKVPLPSLAAQPRFLDMLMDEANLSSAITSPHVAQTHDLVREGDTVFLVMELVVGVALRTLERRFVDHQPYDFPIPVALRILAQSARGLHDAHEARDVRGQPMSLVHRDVSPHNILLGVDGRARIADFGIAHAAHRLTETRTGETKGKLAYFAPEQLVGDAVDRRVDVFALGVVAYELLTGVRPFDADNPLAIAMNIAQKSVPRVATLRPEVPVEVSDLVAHAMTRDRDRRLPSCAAFAERLEALSSLASADDVGALVRRQHATRIDAIQRALALAADADDIAAIAQQLETPLSSENGESAPEPSAAPTFVGDPVLPIATSSELEPDDAPLPFDLEAQAPRAASVVPTQPATPFPETPPPSRLPRHVLVAAMVIIAACSLVAWLGLVRTVLALVLVVMVAIPIGWRLRHGR
ncbi:MAG: serine/threonine protein kinase [Deltaproteobacteria bacterium]|nr:serine/threonine protein kinase [Deltaproteobacteria bacterium]